jgi:hypothetical protein
MTRRDLGTLRKVMLDHASAAPLSEQVPKARPPSNFFGNVFFGTITMGREMEISFMNRKNDDIGAENVEIALRIDEFLFVLTVLAFVEGDSNTQPIGSQAKHLAEGADRITAEYGEVYCARTLAVRFWRTALKEGPASLPSCIVIPGIDHQ